MSLPLVSILIPVYNPTSDIIEVCTSINSQTYNNIEVVVVDDCSTEGFKFLEALAFPRFASKFVRLPRNSGSCAMPLNFGIAASSGSLISVAAQDDFFVCDKIESQVELMLRNPNFGMCFTDNAIIRVNSTDQRKSRTPRRRGGDIFEDLIFQRFYIPSTSVMLRRDVLLSESGYDEKLYLEDWDMHLRVSRLYSVGYIPRPLVVTRVVASSMSQVVSASFMSNSRLAVLAKWEVLPIQKTAVKILAFLDHRVQGGSWVGLFSGFLVALVVIRQPYRLTRIFIRNFLCRVGMAP